MLVLHQRPFWFDEWDYLAWAVIVLLLNTLYSLLCMSLIRTIVMKLHVCASVLTYHEKLFGFVFSFEWRNHPSYIDRLVLRLCVS